MIWKSRERVAIVGCGAISHQGEDWRTLNLARVDEPRSAIATHPDVPCLPAAEIAVDPRLARMASKGARLSVAAAVKAVADAGWSEPRDAGFFLGVGASGGSVEDLEALTSASTQDGAFSAARFGTSGLRAANPLLAFQLMNNFTLCHAAIATGAAGPNLALFSRGARTVGAFVEAMQSIADGECDRALAGGADSALHPLTIAELAREGNLRGPLSEGAAIFALARESEKAIAYLEAAAVAPVEVGWDALLQSVHPERGARSAPSRRDSPRVARLAQAERTGLSWPAEALAATPALALAAALAEITRGRDCVVIRHAGIDGQIGALVVGRP